MTFDFLINSNQHCKMAWQELNAIETINSFASEEKPQLIFKHSPRCGISSMVLRNFENSEFYKSGSDDFWLLNVLESRSISNALADDLNVRHESPQVLVLFQGKLIHHASHSGIDANEIESAIRSIK